LDGHVWALKANSLTSPLTVTVTNPNPNHTPKPIASLNLSKYAQ